MMIQSTGASRPLLLNSALSPLKDLASINAETVVSAALRFCAVICGAGILAASTNAVVEAGHLAGADATLVAALAAGVAAGSIVAPRAQRGLAFVIVAALICGEAFNLLSAAERIIATRETAASSIKGSNDKYAAASARLARAEAAQTAHRGTAVTAVALPSCAKECRALLESQAAAITAEIAEARNAVDAAPVVRSTTPLADRIGWSPWALDLLAASLLSIAANGLAAVLIAFGARPDPRSRTAPLVNAFSPMPPVAQIVDHAAQVTPVASENDDPTLPRGGLPFPASDRTRGLLRLIADGGVIEGSQRDLAQRVGMSRTTFTRALGELEASGHGVVKADKLAGTRIAIQ